MGLNRFSTVGQSEYTAQHVPLPFDTISKLGETIKLEHAAKQAEADALADQLNKIDVADQVLVNTPGSGSGIGYASTGYRELKDKTINKYSQESKKLADEYYATGDEAKFKQGVAKQKADFSQDYQKLKIAEANSKSIREMDKKYRDNEEVGINTYLANQLADHGDQFLKDPYSTEYKGAPIGKANNEEEEVNKHASNFADQIAGDKSFRDSHGNVIYQKFHGVAAERIGAEVDSTYDSTVGIHTQQKVKRAMIAQGIPLDDFKVDKDGNKVYTADLMYKLEKERFKAAVIAKAEKSVMSQSEKKDWQLAKQWDWNHEEKAAEAATKLVGNALPGSEVNVLAQDPQAQSLFGKGVIKVNTDGTVDVDFTALAKEKSKTFTTTASNGKTYNFETQQEASNFIKNMSKDGGMKFTGITSKPNEAINTELDNFITKAAKVAGFNPQQLADLKSGKAVNAKGEKISWNSQFKNILTAYNQLSKVRMGGVQLPAAVQQIESSRVSASPTSYDVFDPVTHNAIPNTINKGDKVLVGERVYIDGQAFDRTTIQRGLASDKNPITETVLLKPKSLERNDYFDRGVASTQNAILDMTIAGGDMTKEQLQKHAPGIDPKKDLHVETTFDHDNDPLTPGIKTKVSTFAKGVLSNNDGETVSYKFAKNDNNLQQQVYFLDTPKGRLRFNDYATFLTHADAAYYLYGQGKHDATAIKNKYIYERMLSGTTQTETEEE